ncbi:MAG: ADP-ribosylglycohydrolase family protein [Bacteroidetes bacterium]|nr:ADP-ribosylglycohydrolase family protein [Bacteroidota bacterium]
MLTTEQIDGAIIGLLVGDALGVPYEFHPPGRIPHPHLIEFAPPAGFFRSHSGVPIGTWSDDGALALCLLASLVECNELNVDDLASRMTRWLNNGYMAVRNQVFDVGIATAEAIESLDAGADPMRAGRTDEMSNGNGSLMRVLPLALWHRGSDAELARDAELQSRLTHGHRRSRLCCALYVLWARRTAAGAADPWLDAADTLMEIHADDHEALEELEEAIRPYEERAVSGSGYVVDALHSARWAVEQGPYEVAVKAAVSLGNDTDTTACIAGGIAGLRDGLDAIPSRWRNGLRGREILDPLLAAFHSQRAAG